MELSGGEILGSDVTSARMIWWDGLREESMSHWGQWGRQHRPSCPNV